MAALETRPAWNSSARNRHSGTKGAAIVCEFVRISVDYERVFHQTSLNIGHDGAQSRAHVAIFDGSLSQGVLFRIQDLDDMYAAEVGAVATLEMHKDRAGLLRPLLSFRIWHRTSAYGGIDIQLLGVGTDGHIGFEGTLSPMTPASAIQLHPRVTVYVDEGAVSKLADIAYYRYAQEQAES